MASDPVIAQDIGNEDAASFLLGDNQQDDAASFLLGDSPSSEQSVAPSEPPVSGTSFQAPKISKTAATGRRFSECVLQLDPGQVGALARVGVAKEGDTSGALGFMADKAYPRLTAAVRSAAFGYNAFGDSDLGVTLEDLKAASEKDPSIRNLVVDGMAMRDVSLKAAEGRSADDIFWAGKELEKQIRDQVLKEQAEGKSFQDARIAGQSEKEKALGKRYTKLMTVAGTEPVINGSSDKPSETKAYVLGEGWVGGSDFVEKQVAERFNAQAVPGIHRPPLSEREVAEGVMQAIQIGRAHV